jgi:hypothetical protein
VQKTIEQSHMIGLPLTISPEFALKWFVGITEAIESLSNSPLRCAKALECDKFPFELRELLYGTKKNKHRILFTVVDDVVNILHIRHSARRELKEKDI